MRPATRVHRAHPRYITVMQLILPKAYGPPDPAQSLSRTPSPTPIEFIQE